MHFSNVLLFPIFTIDEIFDKLDSASIFYGHYEYLVISFGFTSVPYTFESSMNDLFLPYL